jgi:hypothetical protein
MLVTPRRIGFLVCVCLIAARQYAADRSLQEKNVDQLFAAYDKARSPGCALGIIRNEQFFTSTPMALQTSNWAIL